jgi:transposase
MLPRAERKEFHALMGEFRKDPRGLSRKDQRQLAELFARLPQLRTLHRFRRRFQRIFDTAGDRQKAHRRRLSLFLDMLDTFPELDRFIATFEHWQEEILNYFDARQTRGPVEGINNKARVILRRAYGLKSADSLWTRLILDLNRAKDVVLHTIGQIQELARGFRAMFACT